MRRQEAARIWMEEQINELEGLGPHGRTPKQEEQLRAMKLEMEFRKRAQEAAKDEEDEVQSFDHVLSLFRTEKIVIPPTTAKRLSGHSKRFFFLERLFYE